MERKSKPYKQRLGPLQPLVEAAAAEAGQNINEWVRGACAMRLGVPAPDMAAGNPEIAKHAKDGAKARWKKGGK